MIGAGEPVRRERIRDGDGRHPGGARGLDARRGILDDAAFAGRDAHPFRGPEEDIGSGLAAGDVLRADDHRKEAPEAAHLQDRVNDGVERTGGQRQQIACRQVCHQTGRVGEEGLILAQDFQEAALLPRDQFVDGLRRLMPIDEVLPQRPVRAPVVRLEFDPVCPGVTHCGEDLAEGPLVPRLAVHDDAIHVKNDCPESDHRF
ncbi:MAG: hypothetical protein IT577_00655 [Verrucomicrobiae bacterium]|nr:hypothetical protein [Verrucomicrobiae bacterium]